MKSARWIAVVTAVTLGGLLLIVGLGVLTERLVVIIENVGETDVNLTVHVVNGDQFYWQGQVKSGDRVTRLARFSDNSFRVACKRLVKLQRPLSQGRTSQPTRSGSRDVFTRRCIALPPTV